MFKRLLCVVALCALCELTKAYHVQLEQISTLQGLTSPEVTALEYQENGPLLVGTQSGFCEIRNGIVNKIRAIEADGVNREIGRVYDIKSITSYRALIACEYGTFEYDFSNHSYVLLKYDEKDIITNSLAINESSAFFYSSLDNKLFKYDYSSHSVSEVFRFVKKSDYRFEKIINLQEKNLMLLCDDKEGVFLYDGATGIIEHIDKIENQIIARATYVDSDNYLWIANEGGKLICYDINAGYTENGSFNLKNENNDEISIKSLIEQHNGNLVISTEKDGIILFNKVTGDVKFRQNELIRNVSSLCIVKNNVVMGTIFNGVVVAHRSFYYTMNEWSFSDNKLSGSIVLSAYDDENGKIWFGTGGYGLNLYDEVNDKTYYYPETEHLTINRICSFDKDRLLIGTYSSGYLLFNKNTGMLDNNLLESIFERSNIDISNNNSLLIQPCKDGNYLVFNSEDGNFLYNPKTGEKRHFNTCKNQKTGLSEPVSKVIIRDSCIITVSKRTIGELSLESFLDKHLYTSNYNIPDCFLDKDENIWFSDYDKLLKYDRKNNQIVTKLHTTLNREIRSIAYDKSGFIWFSSESGYIYSYNVGQDSYLLYGKSDGITQQTYLKSFSLFSSKDRLYFPRVDGVLVLDTHEIEQSQTFHNRISCLSVSVNGEVIDESELKNLKINNGYKSFEINLKFDNDDPTVPIDYQICLERKRRGTTPIYNLSNNVSWSNYLSNMIPAGRYNLKIMDLNNYGWSEPYSILQFKIKSPWWLSWWFYVLLLFPILVLISIMLYNRHKNKILNLEKKYNEILMQNKESRVRFITNIAHELRTPLSLVINPFKDLILERIFDETNKLVVDRMLHQLNKMKKMIDMILDSNSESDMSICDRLEKVDLNEWTKKLIEPYYNDCERKGLHLNFVPCAETIVITLDKDILEIAITNILTNAIKYSDSGIITLSINSTDNRILISVADQGRGFECDPNNLFVRGFRESLSDDNNGYGIGLNLAYTQLKKIGGIIRAEKNVGKGSIFTIDFPKNVSFDLSVSSYVDEQLKGKVKNVENANNEEKSLNHIDFSTSQKTIIFVDDDSDMCEYIKKSFKSKFRTIYVANNGAIALSIIKEKLPDIVVSDINMPDINGFELCKAIKSNIELSNIPVILFTVRTNPQVRMMGYKLGADGFLAKPFEMDELYGLIQNKLWNRFEIKKLYSQSFYSTISIDQTFSAVDEKFVLDLNKFINDNISNQDLSVDMIYDYMNISRSTLFNKMNSLLGTSTIKYIRGMRIGLAKELLVKTDKSVLDIALECGFADSQYLSSVFKQETGETPTQYRKNAKNASLNGGGGGW